MSQELNWHYNGDGTYSATFIADADKKIVLRWVVQYQDDGHDGGFDVTLVTKTSRIPMGWPICVLSVAKRSCEKACRAVSLLATVFTHEAKLAMKPDDEHLRVLNALKAIAGSAGPSGVNVYLKEILVHDNKRLHWEYDEENQKYTFRAVTRDEHEKGT